MTPDPMLRVRDLVVTYGDTPALMGVSIEVPPEAIVSVVGPNGAGKSTLVQTVAGALSPREGTIEYEGRSIAGKAPEELARRGVALVPENRHIFGTLTVEENLRVADAKNRGAFSRRGTGVFDEVFELFPVLQRYLDRPAARMSGGEQQQLAIARALLGRPRLLMLDEPSLGLAPVIVDQLFDMIATLPARGITVLLIEQNASRAMDLASHSYVLRSGRLEMEGSAHDIAASGTFESAYLGFG